MPTRSPAIPIQDLTAYLTEEQVEKLMSKAKNIRDLLLVRIPWRTGIRVGELVSLRVQDVDYENRALVIVHEKMRKRSGDIRQVRRRVPVDAETLGLIQKYLKWSTQWGYDGELLFPIGTHRVDAIMKTLGRRARITQVGDPAISKHLGMHTHLLRHSFAVHCVKHGMPIVDLQKILGHSFPAAAAIYLQFIDEDLHTSYDQVWAKDGEKAPA